jgi:hypothetical protein
MNSIAQSTITQDIRGSPPTWGYVHQLFIFFIIFFQSSYMHRATKPTPHRTRGLCAPRQIFLPELGHNTKPSYTVCTPASYNRLHLTLQVLTHSMLAQFICIPSYTVCTPASYNHLHLALQVLTHSMLA